MTQVSKNGKVVLITGATSGIGRHAALHLAERGHRVFASGRRETKLRELEAEAQKHGWSIEGLVADVTSQDAIAQLKTDVDERTQGYGVDVLVNNAGYGHLAPTELVTDDEMRQQFDTNVFGLMSITRAFLPAMKQRGHGRVINVSSVGGRLTLPLFGVYNATKYAVESLSDALRLELRAFGIDVVLIEPGVIDTGFADVSMSIVGSYDQHSGDYAPVFARAGELKKQTDAIAAQPIVISKAITRAVESRRPRARYVAPFSARLMLAAAAVMPTRMLDWVMRRSAGLTRQQMLPGKSSAVRAHASV